MRNQWPALLCIVAVLGPLAATKPTLAEQAKPRQVTSEGRGRSKKLQVLELAVNHSLHEAAKANGGWFTMQHPGHDDTLARDLEMLTRASTVIVVGRPLMATPQLSPDGKMIHTYYDIRVSATLKGPAAAAVVLRYPGGTWGFGDGSVAEVVLAPDVPILLNREYILFLRTRTGINTNPADTERGVLALTSGSQSIFEVAAGKVKSLALPDVPIYRQLHGLDAATLNQRTRGLVVAGPEGPN